MQYAIETLEIEQSRLVEAIREMRAIAVTEEDHPGSRVKEQREAIDDIEQTVAFLWQAAKHTGNFPTQCEAPWGSNRERGE